MGGVHRISAGKAARAPTPGAPSASVGLILRLAPGSPPRCGRARLPFALIIKGTKPWLNSDKELIYLSTVS